MRVLPKILLLILIACSFPLHLIKAQTTVPQDTFYKARVNNILDEGTKSVNAIEIPYQIVEVELLEGNQKGNTLMIDHGTTFSIDKSKFVENGQTVVVVQTIGPEGTPTYQIVDKYRTPSLLPFLIAFAIAVILLSGWRGVGSMIGMGISLIIIAKYIVPNIMNGSDPLMITIIGGSIIMITTIYLAHGFSRQTTLALVSTAATLLFIGLLSVVITQIMHLTGLGSEDAYSLKLGPNANINFRGLLLGGILIGALGVLDDVTTALSASIFELNRANPKLAFIELSKAGLRIGREHITSLVNTLVLAYAGASLPVFIILITNPNNYPFWLILNSETIIEEIVRTLAGSFGLVFAVPFTTFIVSWSLKKFPLKYHSSD